MLKFRSSYLFIFIFLFLTGCYTNSKLPSLSPNVVNLKKHLYIQTKNGKIIELVTYEIKEDKILGKDKYDKNHEIQLNNIEVVTQKKFTKTGRTVNKIVISSFIASIVFIIYYYLGMKGFSQLK